MLNSFLKALDFNDKPKGAKIVVAMSGGVDSSVAAALLKEQNYNVIGITLQLYDPGQILKKKGACCAGADIEDARKVAEKFDFPHYVVNYESLFREEVIDYFADSYLRGETPIPCVKCNQSVKFADLLKMAQNLGAEALVTGHYAQRINNLEGIALHKGLDPSKDQSYFLFTTTKAQLEFVRFPLGQFTKEQTRKEAQRLGLEVALKPDSQDICFVPNGDYGKVIANLRPGAFKKGEIIHIVSKEVLGEHNGIINYTIGQRRGLGISASEPLFVVEIDAKKNQILVGPESALKQQFFSVRELNWLGGREVFESELEVTVKLRSAHEGAKARVLAFSDGTAKVAMMDDARAVTPGQACVFYQDDRLLGGGWIGSN